MALEQRSSIVGGSIWMVVIAVALFFLPAINGLVGGMVGGYKVGGAGRATLAALLPGAVTAAALWLVFVVLDLPVLGLFAGAAAGILIVLSEIGLLIGAAIGGAIRGRPATA